MSSYGFAHESSAYRTGGSLICELHYVSFVLLDGTAGSERFDDKSRRCNNNMSYPTFSYKDRKCRQARTRALNRSLPHWRRQEMSGPRNILLIEIAERVSKTFFRKSPRGRLSA